MRPGIPPRAGKTASTGTSTATTVMTMLLPALTLLSAAAARGQSLVEHKGTVVGTLVGRIEIFQADDAIHVAFAENRSDGLAVLTRGAKSYKLAGRWSTCQHGEVASYCQLAGSSAVYRFDRSVMSREQRTQPTQLLAATATGYAARVSAPAGDVLVHHAGVSERILASGRVTQAWSNGEDVAYRPDGLTTRIVSLIDLHARDVETSGAVLANVEQNDGSSGGDAYQCRATRSHCAQGGLVGCFVTEISCACRSDAETCPLGRHYTSQSIHCPDPRLDEPICGGDPDCLPSAIAHSGGGISGVGTCGGTIFGFHCEGAAAGGKCSSEQPFRVPSVAPPDIQVTTSPVRVAGAILPAGTRITAYARASGEIYVAVP